MGALIILVVFILVVCASARYSKVANSQGAIVARLKVGVPAIAAAIAVFCWRLEFHSVLLVPTLSRSICWHLFMQSKCRSIGRCVIGGAAAAGVGPPLGRL